MDGGKPRRPGFSYLSIVAIAILAAWFFARPLGLHIRDILQSLVDAFGNR